MTVQVNYSPSNGIVSYLGNTKYTSHKVVQDKESDQLSVTQMVATSLHSSTRMKKRSNLDMMGAVMLMFCWRERRGRRTEREGGGRERRRRAEGEKVEKERRRRRKREGEGRGRDVTCLIHDLYHVILCYTVLP